MSAGRLTLLVAFLAAVAGCDGPPTGGRTELPGAVEARRFEPRFSWTASYAPCVVANGEDRSTAHPGCVGAPPASTVDLAAAARAATVIARGEDGAERLRALAALDLMLGEPRRGSLRAIESLRAARAQDPSRQDIAADLSAALLVAARAFDEPRHLVEALDVALAARDAGTTSQALCFNEGLAWRELGLGASARRTWSACTERFPDGPWAEEARSRALPPAVAAGDERWQRWLRGAEDGEPEGALPPRLTAAAQDAFLQALLTDWAETVPVEGEEGSTRHLDHARRLARVLDRNSQGRFHGRSVEGAVPRSGNDPVRLAAAFRDLRQGMEAVRNGRGDVADDHLGNALPILGDTGSPLEMVARHELSVVDYQRGDYDGALRGLDSVALLSRRSGFPGTLGRADALRGVIHSIRGDHVLAEEARLRAVESLSTAGDLSGSAAARIDLARTYRFLGSPEAWDHLLSALHTLDDIDRPQVRARILAEAAQASAEARRWTTAVAFSDLVLVEAERVGTPLARLGALRERAELLTASDRPGEAVRALRAASADTARLEEAVQAVVSGELVLAEAELHASSEPARALRSAAEARDLFETWEYEPGLQRALGVLGRSAAALGRSEEAAGAFDHALRLIEERRGLLGEASRRMGYMDRADPLYARVADFRAAALGDPRGALEAAELGRSRELRDALGSLPASSTLVDFVQSSLSDESVVVYEAGPASLWAFVVDRTEVSAHRLSADPDRLATLADRIAAGARASDEEELESVGSELFDALVRPILAHVSASHLVMSPVGALHRVPFAALFDRQRGRYLAETHHVTIAPSASVYAASKREAGRAEPTSAGGLAVGDPRTDPTRSGLPRLPGSADEATLVAALHPGTLLLLDGDATRGRVVEAAADRRFVHLATHAIVDAADPEGSAIVLASTPEDDGLIRADDIERFGWNAELVILASCGSYGAAPSSSEGLMGLAASFLQAGVPGVLASRWPVSDVDAFRFFSLFHQHYADGADPVDALTATRRVLIEESRGGTVPPTAWSSFEFIGAVAPPSSRRQ